MVIKDLDLRLAAVEKECDRLAAPDHDDLRQRLTNLEKAYTVLKKHLEVVWARTQKLDAREGSAPAAAPLTEERAAPGKETGPARVLTFGKASPADREKEGRR